MHFRFHLLGAVLGASLCFQTGVKGDEKPPRELKLQAVSFEFRDDGKWLGTGFKLWGAPGSQAFLRTGSDKAYRLWHVSAGTASQVKFETLTPVTGVEIQCLALGEVSWFRRVVSYSPTDASLLRVENGLAEAVLDTQGKNISVSVALDLGNDLLFCGGGKELGDKLFWRFRDGRAVSVAAPDSVKECGFLHSSIEADGRVRIGRWAEEGPVYWVEDLKLVEIPKPNVPEEIRIAEWNFKWRHLPAGWFLCTSHKKKELARAWMQEGDALKPVTLSSGAVLEHIRLDVHLCAGQLLLSGSGTSGKKSDDYMNVIYTLKGAVAEPVKIGSESFEYTEILMSGGRVFFSALRSLEEANLLFVLQDGAGVAVIDEDGKQLKTRELEDIGCQGRVFVWLIEGYEMGVLEGARVRKLKCARFDTAYKRAGFLLGDAGHQFFMIRPMVQSFRESALFWMDGDYALHAVKDPDGKAMDGDRLGAVMTGKELYVTCKERNSKMTRDELYWMPLEKGPLAK